jgi:hypothetical protein
MVQRQDLKVEMSGHWAVGVKLGSWTPRAEVVEDGDGVVDSIVEVLLPPVAKLGCRT